MKFFKLLSLAIFILLFSSLVFALPDSSTDRAGNRCEREHNFHYNYDFNYENNMIVGKSYDFDISFRISGSTVTRNPYIVDVRIIPDGFQLSKDHVSLDNDQETIKITPTKVNPSLTIKTKLTLDGDDHNHRGYKATYRDVSELNDFSVLIKDKKEEKTVLPIDNSTQQKINDSEKAISVQKSLTDNKEITKTTTTNSNRINTNVQVAVNQPSKAPWYIVRITGIIAFILLSFSVLIALIRKINQEKFTRLISLHKEVSILAVIFSLLHMLNLFWDKYEWSLNIKEILWLDFSTKTKIMLSLGVVAFYLLLIITLTSITPKIIRALKYKKWHLIHLLSYLTYIAVIIHSIFLGTDLKLSELNNPLTLISFAVFFAFITLNIVFFISWAIIGVFGVKR